MMGISELLKRAGADGRGRLVPFFKAVCVYFVVGGGSPSAVSVASKCAPVLSLLLCVLLSHHNDPERRRYARLVALGLALSATGDALLVWEQHFVAGMAAFAGAHVAYIAAFGWRPRAGALGLALLAAAAWFSRVLTPPRALATPVSLYALLLAAMAWRGAAAPGRQRVGALLFLLSDAILGYSLFGGPVPYKQVLVMSTYYLGQLGIALSALEPTKASDAKANTVCAQ